MADMLYFNVKFHDELPGNAGADIEISIPQAVMASLAWADETGKALENCLPIRLVPLSDGKASYTLRDGLLIPEQAKTLICRVYNDEIIVVRLLVNDQIVYGTTVLIAHWAVSRTTVLQIRVVVRQHVIQKLQCLLALNQNLSHMGNVEQAALRPHCHMLLLDTGFVLNRQQKTTEVHDASTVLHMGVIKGCFFSFHFCTSIRTLNSFPILSFTKSAVNMPKPLAE